MITSCSVIDVITSCSVIDVITSCSVIDVITSCSVDAWKLDFGGESCSVYFG